MSNTVVKDYSISVVIPFYNRAMFITDCLDSIVNQTYSVSEIIIVDDCSRSEENQSLLDKTRLYEKHGIPIKVITLPQNGGVSYARNMGVANASGDYIAFLDSDDYWDLNKIEIQMAFFEQHPDCDAVHSGTLLFNSRGEIKRYVNKPELLTIAELLKSSQVTPSTFIIKKQIFRAVDGFNSKIKMSEDYDLTIRLVLQDCKIYCINEPLTYFRRDDQEKLTDNTWNYFIWHMFLLFKYRHLYIAEEGVFALNKYTAKYLYRSAKKIGGIGNVFTLLAVIIYPAMLYTKFTGT